MKKSKINVGVVNRKKKLIQKIKNTKFKKKYSIKNMNKFNLILI